MSYKKIFTVLLSIIYHIIRWLIILVAGFIILFHIDELFTYECEDFYRCPGNNTWNYGGPEYYYISIRTGLISSLIYFLLSVFSYKMPKHKYLLIILAWYLIGRLIFFQYSADNPPEWIFNIL